MPRFFATCPQGISKALKEELESFDLNLKSVHDTERGVQFESSWESAFKINFKTKLASRVLKPVLDFTSSTEEQILSHFKKHDFSKYLSKDGSFSLKVKIQSSSKYKDQRVVMNLLRVGLLEEFKKKGRSDIRVDREKADLEIVVVVYRANFSVSLNMSGEPLSNRGYRKEALKAPLRENLAAGLVRLTGWKANQEPLVDFMCGTGTLLIEASRLNQSNSLKRDYAFERWETTDQKQVEAIKKELSENSKKPYENLYGFDQDPRSIEASMTASKELGLNIQIKQLSLKDLNANVLPKGPGVVLLNPPYGKRLGNVDQSKKTYALIGEKLKSEFKGWRAFILSPDPELSKELKMKAFFKQRVDNGGVECLLLGYGINS
jgi:putative N6-adenine-specific DNA methylase